MSKLSLAILQSASDSAGEVIAALAGENDDAHPDNSRKMCELWDNLNDRHAPPCVVKAMADELINIRVTNQKLRAQRIADRRRFSNPAPEKLTLILKDGGNRNDQ